MGRTLLAVLVGLSALAAGAALASHTDYLFDPAQFRQHAEEEWFHLYWNYRRPAPDLLEAEGYVRAKALSPDIEMITLELVGLDGAGEPVSRGLGVTRGGKIAWGGEPALCRPPPPHRQGADLPPQDLAPQASPVTAGLEPDQRAPRSARLT